MGLEAAGFKPGEIAEIVGMSDSRVSTILNDHRADIDRKEFAAKTIDRVQDVQLKIALHADEALEEIIDEMRNCEDPRVRQKASFGILGLAGYTPVQKQLVAKAEVPPEVVQGGLQVLQEMKAIEADYKVIEADEVEDMDEDTS